MLSSKARVSAIGSKLTAVNPEKIARLRDDDLVSLHDRLHELHQLGVKLDDEEVCQRINGCLEGR